jgi:basic amino acid/polyamine antiporter, APA family
MQSQPTSLVRVLGPWMATAIVIGTVIGSGVFKKARNVAENVPEFGLAMGVWVLVGLLALLGALAIAEVAVLFPRAGGNYIFLKEAYGRMAGFLWGWVDFWIIRAASIAALATMFTESLHDVLKQSLHEGTAGDVLSFWPRQLLTAVVIVVLAAVNARGTRLGGILQLIVTTVKVGSLVFIAVLPFAVVAAVSEPQAPPKIEHLKPTWPADWGLVKWGAFGSAMVGVIWAYHGWMNIGMMAGEVKNPQRNIPLALFVGIGVLILLYCSANAAYYLVMPRADIAAVPKDATVATEFCSRLLGPIGILISSAIVMMSVFGALNGNLLAGPRLLYAMGQDGLAPRRLQELHPRYATPAFATFILAAWSCIMVLGVGAMTQYRLPIVPLGFTDLDMNLAPGKSPFDVVTDFAMFGATTFETLAVASVFVFRWKIPATAENRPYRCWGYPVLPAIYVIILSLVVANMFVTPAQQSEAIIGLGFIGIGAGVYLLLFRGRKRF